MSDPSALPASALVLFDIDGTLLRRSGPDHRNSLIDAVRRVTGLQTTTDGIPVQGMLDRDILARMMRQGGASKASIRECMADVTTTAQAIYARRCPDLRSKVCPGTRHLLARLRRAAIPAGLVTGNLSRIGWKKLDRAGLRHYFRFGAFAEDATTRTRLATLAIRHARREGWIDGATPISLIGDHHNDILAAHQNSIRSVAVTTGLSDREELAAHSPDLLVDSLQHVTLNQLRNP